MRFLYERVGDHDLDVMGSCVYCGRQSSYFTMPTGNCDGYRRVKPVGEIALELLARDEDGTAWLEIGVHDTGIEPGVYYLIPVEADKKCECVTDHMTAIAVGAYGQHRQNCLYWKPEDDK